MLASRMVISASCVSMAAVFSETSSSDLLSGVSFWLRVVSAVSMALIALRSSRAVAMSVSSSVVCCWTSFLPPLKGFRPSSMCGLRGRNCNPAIGGARRELHRPDRCG
jgi:hypothetical protein